jgi:hypothetical protein
LIMFMGVLLVCLMVVRELPSDGNDCRLFIGNVAANFTAWCGALCQPVQGAGPVCVKNCVHLVAT